MNDPIDPAPLPPSQPLIVATASDLVVRPAPMLPGIVDHETERADAYARAARAGKHIGVVCERIHAAEGELGVRRILGVLAYAKKYGAATVDAACATALDVGVPTYRFVKNYLERGALPQLGLKQVDPLIRELTEYRDLIERITRRTE